MCFPLNLIQRRRIDILDLPAHCRKLQKTSNSSVRNMMHALTGEVFSSTFLCSKMGSTAAATLKAYLFKPRCFIYRIAMPSLIPMAFRNCSSRVPAKQDLLFIKLNTPKCHLEWGGGETTTKPSPVCYHSYNTVIMTSVCKSSNTFSLIY